MTISICAPVLKRYDLLREMVRSAQAGNVKPDVYYIIDNGQNNGKLMKALQDFDILARVHTPKRPLGIAESWNWFLTHVPEERIIVNDDIEFGPTSLEQIVACPADLVLAGVGFSGFLMRDTCVAKIGYFDETISPGYGYYEDEDYMRRFDRQEPPLLKAENVPCGIIHRHSSTLKAASHIELLEHHRRFKIAQANYAAKWGLEKEFEKERAGDVYAQVHK